MRRASLKWFMTLTVVSLGAFVACGGDDSNAGNGEPDASAGADGAAFDGSIGTDASTSEASTGPSANASDVDVYLTQTAHLDASASTPSGSSFQWLLASAPGGSAISTASLMNASSATPSFVPDVLGTYVLTLKVTSASASATKNVSVRAFPGKAVFAHVHPVDGGTQSDVQFAPTVGGDGGATTISCETLYMQTFTNGGGSSPPEAFGSNGLPAALDWREGAPAEEAKIAFGFRDLADDGGFTNYLATGTTGSHCDTIRKVDPILNAGEVPYSLRISPNGTRVAYVRQNGTTIDVATIGMDGSNPYVLGSLFRTSDGDAGALPTSSFEKRRVAWVDDTHVAWIADDTDVPGNFSVLTATDGPAPSPTVYMDCAASTGPTSQATVTQFAMLPGGIVLVGGTITTVDAGPSGIVALRPNASTKQCEVAGPPIGVNATSFAVSPEGSRIAYFGINEDAGTTDLWIGPLDGGDPTALRPGDAGVPYATGFGPQWAQGGTAIVLSTIGSVVDGGSTENVSVIPVGGSSMSAIASSDSAGDQYFVPTSQWSCNVGRTPAAPAIGAFLSFGIFMLLRRNKKKDRDS